MDDGEGGDEVGGVGALVRVQRRVVHDLLLRQRVRLRRERSERTVQSDTSVWRRAKIHVYLILRDKMICVANIFCEFSWLASSAWHKSAGLAQQ